MDLELHLVPGGGLECIVSHRGERAQFTCAGAAEALRALRSALDELTVQGCAECFWHVPAGSYRWLFRQDGDLLRVAVVYSVGVVTGWEHLFWAEGACAEIFEPLRAAAVSQSATL